jgi:hypothetical protein
MPERLAALLESTTLNGIDFVEVASDDQTNLVVHFLNTVPVTFTDVTITRGEKPPTVPVTPGAMTADPDGRPLLALTTPFAGDFSYYELRIASPELDPFYAAVRFSFKARCPSDLDCACQEPDCSPPGGPAPPIDYLAKDFDSFKRALEDYSSVAYPDWHERAEADLGVVLLELMASVGDDLSYLQDRVSAEATLPTATQRRSVTRHARLVDYEPRPNTSATVTVQVDVASGPLPAGTLVTAPAPDGGAIPFELGSGLADSTPLTADPRWNSGIEPYWWDDARRCLSKGATEMWIRGQGYGFPTAEPQLGIEGLPLLIDTAAAASIDPPIREIVHLTLSEEVTDPLFGEALTHLRWREPLAHEHDLTRTRLAGNLLPATEGRRHTERITVDAVVVRQGPNASCDDDMPIYLHTLRQGRLAWLGDAPEVLASEPETPAGDPARAWEWRRRLLEAAPFERAFMVEPSRYTLVRGAFEYDGDDADSLRFGDGVFGERPAPGTEFDITYRVTAGSRGNVAAGAITGVDPAMAGIVLAVMNPFGAAGGADEEQLDSVRRLAPDAFKARLLRAVRAPDYNAAAEEVDWVLDAGTSFRWTGTWLTVFSTALPRGGGLPDDTELIELIELLNRRRLAGYEVYVPEPRYVGIDLIITVCAHAWALRGEVEAAVIAQVSAFFAPDNFRFGTPLERSELDVACQRATGVEGVVSIELRRRGITAGFEPMPETVSVGRDEVIRCDGDPSLPEHGSLRVVVQGGK